MRACLPACLPACLSIDVGRWKRIIKRVKIIVFPSSVQFRPSWKRGSLARLIISFRKTLQAGGESREISKSFASSRHARLPRGQLLPRENEIAFRNSLVQLINQTFSWVREIGPKWWRELKAVETLGNSPPSTTVQF